MQGTRTRDFWAGVVYMVFGLATMLLARGLPMGSTARMGSGYFPTLLGGLLVVIGLIAVLRGLRAPGETVPRIHLRPAALVIGASATITPQTRSAPASTARSAATIQPGSMTESASVVITSALLRAARSIASRRARPALERLCHRSGHRIHLSERVHETGSSPGTSGAAETSGVGSLTG